MKKVLTAATLLAVMLLAGCSQEKAQVTTYLKALEASNTKMKTIAEDMQKSMSGLPAQIQSGEFDAEAIKGQISSFADKMKEEKTHIEGLEVPAKAQGLHDVIVKQYQTAIDVLGETAPMIDIAKQMSDAQGMMKKDPTKAKDIMAEMKAAQEKMMGIQAKVQELANQGQEYEKQAQDEQKKLQEEFGIEIKTDASPAAAASPAASPAEAK